MPSGDPSENNMPIWRPIRNLWSGMSVFDEVCRSPMGLWLGMSISDETYRSQIRHVGLWWVSDQACWSPMRHVGLYTSPMRHVCLWQVSDEACRNPMGLWSGMLFYNGSPIRHVGLWLGMSVSNWSPIIHVGIRWVPNGSSIGLRWVSDRFTQIILLSETHRRTTCLIGDPSETYQRPIRDL